MPEESDYGDFFAGEYPSIYFFNKSFPSASDWLENDDFRYHRPNIKMKKLMAHYFDDSSKNCSYDLAAIDFLIPAPFLIKEMDLIYGGEDACYTDLTGKRLFLTLIQLQMVLIQ